MTTEIIVPDMGESVIDATIARWMKNIGDAVQPGDAVVELETDKVNLEVSAAGSGRLEEIFHPVGDTVKVGDLLGRIREHAAGSAGSNSIDRNDQVSEEEFRASHPDDNGIKVTPLARRVAEDLGANLHAIQGSGPGGKITRSDVEGRSGSSNQPPLAGEASKPVSLRLEERIRMTRRRQTIARRLVEAQHTAAMLTTFNEIDMLAVMDLRKRRREGFKQRHGVDLGFMSFFVKAVIVALKETPNLNNEISGDEIIVKRFYDIGIAVGAPEGLVVPVLRDADQMDFAQIERSIKSFALKAQNGNLGLDDLRGGTFTITNGGVYGSLMSTPILNPPQVGILGMHRIQDRPVAQDGQIIIRPMMYTALSYDHRIVDGREAVQFLVRIKELIEDPGALLIEG